MAENLKPGLGYIVNDQKLPEGAIVISPNYLYELQNRIINRWQPPREMFILKHGSEFMGLFAAVNGAIFTNHFRYKMGLRNYARYVSYAPTLFLPALSVAILHQSVITYPMSIGYLPCVTCAEVKSLLIQSIFGFANPFILAVCASFAMSKLSTCYPLPPFNDYKNLFKTLVKLTRPAKPQILALYTFNLFCIFIIDYKQRNLIDRVNLELLTEDIFVESHSP